MEAKLVETAKRIRGLRDLMEISPEEMAAATGTTTEESI